MRPRRAGASHCLTRCMTRDSCRSIPGDSGSFTSQYDGRTAPFASYDYPFRTLNQTRRQRLGYQTDLALGRSHLLTTGVEYERESGVVGDPDSAPLQAVRNNSGVFVQDQWSAASKAFVTAGVRLEHNASFGVYAAPRLSAAVHLRQGTARAFWGLTKLKGSFGLGIKEPTLVESFSNSPFFRGNPDLRPEKSVSFDAGIEQYLAGGRGVLEFTWFENRFRNQIGFAITDYQSFEGSFFNIGRSEARGIEAGLRLPLSDSVELGASHTFLHSKVLESTVDSDPAFAAGQPLFRRPRHSGRVDLCWKPARWTFAASALVVGSRVDSDFSGLGTRAKPRLRGAGPSRDLPVVAGRVALRRREQRAEPCVHGRAGIPVAARPLPRRRAHVVLREPRRSTTISAARSTWRPSPGGLICLVPHPHRGRGTAERVRAAGSEAALGDLISYCGFLRDTVRMPSEGRVLKLPTSEGIRILYRPTECGISTQRNSRGDSHEQRTRRHRHRIDIARGPPVPATAGVQRQGARQEHGAVPADVPGIDREPGQVLGEGRQAAPLVQALEDGAGVEPALREVVRRGQDQHLVQLPRPAPGRPRARTRPRSSGKANRERSAPSPTSSCTAKSAGSPTGCCRSASRKATASSSTWGWCPSSRWPCWRARASARPTPSSSAAFRPRRSGTGSTTRRLRPS